MSPNLFSTASKGRLVWKSISEKYMQSEEEYNLKLSRVFYNYDINHNYENASHNYDVWNKLQQRFTLVSYSCDLVNPCHDLVNPNLWINFKIIYIHAVIAMTEWNNMSY